MKRRFAIFSIVFLSSFFVFRVETTYAMSLHPGAWFHRAENQIMDRMFLAVGEFEDETVPSKEFTLNIPILAYHQVRPLSASDPWSARRFITSPQEFESQLYYLKHEGYSVISLDEVIDHLVHQTALPSKVVAITFDDGYRSQYVYAYPLLRKYGFTATFFIYTDVINSYFKSMTWKEVKDLAAHGMTIGDHTKSHVSLITIKDAKTLAAEVEVSKHVIESRIGKPVTLFAYPFGDHDAVVDKEIVRAGFLGAFGVRMGRLQTLGDRYGLKRINMDNSHSLFLQALAAE